MSSSVVFTACCLLLYLFSAALIDAADEQFKVDEFYDAVGDDADVPDTLELNFRVDDKPVRLRLDRSDSIPADPPVIVSRDNRRTYWSTKPGSRLTAYIDRDFQSSVVVEKKTHNNGLTTRRYRGNFHVDNKLYNLAPLSGHKTAARLTSRADVRSTTVSIDQVAHVISPVTLDEIRLYDSATSLNRRSSVNYKREGEWNETAKWQRGGKSAKQHYKVELLVVLDYAMYKHWKHHLNGQHDRTIEAVKHYFTQVVSGIDIRYATIVQPDFTIRIHLVGFFIATTANDAPWTEDPNIKTVYKNDEYIDMYKALDRFETWVADDTSDLPPFDHATLYSSNDLYDGSFDNQGRPKTKSGLANIAAVCQKSRRVSINFEYGEYASIQTGAHELGHNLGAQHDGTRNECQGVGQYVMASAPMELSENNFKNALKFSHCSIRYFRKHLSKLTSDNENCLLTESPQHVVADDKYPGRVYSVDEQCQDLYGDDSFFCAGGILEKKLCDAMQCWVADKKICYTQAEQRAYVGTTCGNHKWCMKGKCVSDPRAGATKESCIFGDYRGLVYIDQSTSLTCGDSGRRYPHKCYEESHSKTCCQTCVDIRRNDKPGCEYGDKNPTWCKEGRKQDCYDEKYATTCCDTCAKQKGNEKDCEFGDRASWCATSISAPAWQCYEQHTTCCETCQRFKTSIQDCEYGDRASWCATYGVSASRCTPSDLGKQCCSTCDKLVPGGVQAQPATAKPATNADCPNGDQASYCATIKAENCYDAAKTCCISCAKYKTHIAGCEFGDHASWCAGYVKGPNNCKRQQIAQQCCKSCAKYQRTTNALQKAAAVAECRLMSDAQLPMLCKDAQSLGQCLRCLRQRIARRLHDRV